MIGMIRKGGGCLALLLAIGLAGCADRPGPGFLKPVASAAGVGKPVPVLVATTRERSKDDTYVFTDGRARMLNYERYDVSIPPNHASGKIEWPDKPPGNPARNFVVLDTQSLTRPEFDAALHRDAPQGKPWTGDVAVFVHGYNTNYQEAVYRVAQLTADTEFPGPMVGFVWPSRGKLTGYLADRESTTYSRDYLEQFLDDLAATPGVRRINLIAHSMGNWLAVETLRQAKLRAHSAFLPKLGEVFLMAPDIDIDVFRTQLAVIGKLPQPITVLVSRDDRALGASQALAGDVPRAGNVLVDNPQAQAAIKQYGLRVIDLSDVASDDSMRHSKFLDVMPALRQVAEEDAGKRRGSTVSRTGTFVVGTAGTILLAPLRLGEAVVGQPLLGQ